MVGIDAVLRYKWSLDSYFLCLTSAFFQMKANKCNNRFTSSSSCILSKSFIETSEVVGGRLASNSLDVVSM